MNNTAQSEKKRIALIIPGGIGTGRDNIGVPVLEQAVKGLAEKFEVIVFSLFRINDSYSATSFKLIDVSWPLSIIKYYKLFSLIRTYHHEKRFSVVHGFWALPSGLVAVLIGKMLGVKSIVSLQGGDAASLPNISYGQLRTFWKRQIVFWTLRNAGEVISLTEFQKQTISKLGLRDCKFHIIPFGADPSVFTSREKSLSYPIQFLHIGNFNRVKDQKTLLHAFQKICSQVPAHLTIIGEGYLERDITDLVSQLSLQSVVTLQKTVSHKDLPHYYHEADILLHASLFEGQGVVIAEAMSCGVVVVGTRVGLLSDLDGHACVTASRGNGDELANQVMKLLRQPEKFDELRSAAREWTRNHPLSWTIEKIANLYSI